MNIGHIKLKQPFCQAGLAGYSDRAMRLVARRHGCPYAVTEALLDIVMLNGGQGLRKSIDINGEDHPIAGQIMGSEAEQLAKAAVILADHGYDVIDLNFACPVKKIKNKARGGHMLRDVDRAKDILKRVRDEVPAHVPTTISTRRGFDDSTESRENFFEIIETAWEYGYAAVRVHCRTVEQKYIGRGHWPFLAEVKKKYPQRTILGSGDVFTAHDAVRMLRETGVDIVWIARGAIGNPWIFQHAAQLLSTDVLTGGEHATSPSGVLNPPSIHEQCEALSEHFGIAKEIHGEQLAGRRMRKMGIKYSRFHPQSAEVKKDFINVSSMRDWKNVLEKWYAIEGPGVWPPDKAADEVNEDQTCEVSL